MKARFGSDGGSLERKTAKSEILFPSQWKATEGFQVGK